ncbi:MAG: putative metal-dependent hydrolase [Flammeovirgaceae bacterium]|nr:putative metal-dependent hydrolase [Flammeovirgaceae bacterium]
MNDDQLKYPIGKFIAQDSYTVTELTEFIRRIEALPQKLKRAISGLSDQQFDSPYREGGWTVRQVVHHLADSHTNAYIRFKWALTEDSPTIKTYNEKLWAETPETKLDINLSVNLIQSLHTKFVALLSSLSSTDWNKQFFHPDSKQYIKLERMAALYAWHGEHHVAHITSLIKRMNWK